MAYSSILGADMAPEEPKGREAELLGPSDNSDSGSDTIGTAEADQDTTDAADQKLAKNLTGRKLPLVRTVEINII